MLWTFDDDAARPGFAGAVRELGADAVSAAPSQDPAPFAAKGLTWYEDAAAGKGVLGLRDKDSKPAWDRFWEARRDEWPAAAVRARPVCLRDPAVVKSLEAETARSARRATKGAFAIALDDESSMTVRADPGDWCLCDRCVDAFREEMRGKYREVAALNEAWATAYAGWDEVRPWTTAAAKARVRGRPPEQWNLAPWMETRAFQDRTFASLVAHLRDVALREAPGVPCGITGTQAPSAFGGWDYGLLAKSMSFVEPYDIGLALPICRDLFPPGTVIAQTVFPSGGDELVARWRLWRGVARGANCTIVWSSHDALEREGAPALTPYGRALAADLALLSAPGGLGSKLGNARPSSDAAVILYSQASVDVRWMLDSVEDGDTWPKRLGSYEAAHSKAIAAREAAWRAWSHLAPRFADVRDVVADPRVLDARDVLAPDLICVSAAERAALAKVSADRLRASGPIGLFDELGRATAPVAADRVRIDPEFATDVPRHKMESCVDVTVTRTDGGPAPRVELGLFSTGDGEAIVLVPAWDQSGGGEVRIPRTKLTFTIEQVTQAGLTSPPVPVKDVVDLRTGKRLGRVARWTAESDAAGGLVFELR